MKSLVTPNRRCISRRFLVRNASESICAPVITYPQNKFVDKLLLNGKSKEMSRPSSIPIHLNNLSSNCKWSHILFYRPHSSSRSIKMGVGYVSAIHSTQKLSVTSNYIAICLQHISAQWLQTLNQCWWNHIAYGKGLLSSLLVILHSTRILLSIERHHRYDRFDSMPDD